MEIRPLGPDDAEAFFEIRLKALETCPHAFSASPERFRARGIEGCRSMIQRVENVRVTLGAWSEGRLVGIAGFVRDEGEGLPPTGYVWGVFVDERVRGQGVGAATMDALVEILKSFEGLEQATLEVYEDNHAAAALYRRIGFRTLRVEPGQGETNGTHHMSLDLR